MPQLPPCPGGNPYHLNTSLPSEVFAGKHRKWDHLSLNKIGNWLKRHAPDGHPDAQSYEQRTDKLDYQSDTAHNKQSNKQTSKKAIPGLPRPQTFGRQLSEQRDRLCPYETCEHEQRAVSLDRKGGLSKQLVPLEESSPPPSNIPAINGARDEDETTSRREGEQHEHDCCIGDAHGYQDEADGEPPPTLPAPPSITGPMSGLEELTEAEDEQKLREELEAKWILNLSMHFRDRSEREKFFVTYAEQPNRWRRVTVSCDYRNVPPDSLEQDLKTLHYQRDKNARIYEAIRDSLPSIQFYDTVTNLKLQTTDRQLHVHVTEDVNEIISYPPISSVAHIRCKTYPESALVLESHLSGFVYKVQVDGQTYIKKEIPGPDSVDEFLYELNALYDLRNSKGVISFVGIIVDDRHRLVKGLLISLATRGALVDIIYDEPDLDWVCRERWARQIVQGLSEIHEGGYVQGDFTLSNIVIDANNDAKLIDVNRRGCPMGWEPPEMKAMINSGQRISMYIGVKSDLFQLGMVLWALAVMKDEPERQDRPLINLPGWLDAEIPYYYRDLVETCLNDRPRSRLSAKELLRFFPQLQQQLDGTTTPGHRADAEYIDPADEVSRDDIERYQQRQAATDRSHISIDGRTYVEVPSSSSDLFDSSESYVSRQRSRSPGEISRSARSRRMSRQAPRQDQRRSASLEGFDFDQFLQTPPPEPSSEQANATGDLTRTSASRERLRLPHHVSDRVSVTTPAGSTGSSYAVPSCLSYPISDSGRDVLAGEAAPVPGIVPTFGPPTHQNSGFDEPLVHMVDRNTVSGLVGCNPSRDALSTTKPEPV